MGPRIGNYAPGPSDIGEVVSPIVTFYACLMLVNTSGVGCGGRAPYIAYSRNWALESVVSPPKTYKIREVDIFTVAADAYLVPET